MYLICPVCFWEDCGLDLDKLTSPSEVNGMTLRDGRANFEEFGACCRAMLPHVVPKSEQRLFQHRPRHTA